VLVADVSSRSLTIGVLNATNITIVVAGWVVPNDTDG
jgi:hypothetical protein